MSVSPRRHAFFMDSSCRTRCFHKSADYDFGSQSDDADFSAPSDSPDFRAEIDGGDFGAQSNDGPKASDTAVRVRKQYLMSMCQN